MAKQSPLKSTPLLFKFLLIHLQEDAIAVLKSNFKSLCLFLTMLLSLASNSMAENFRLYALDMPPFSSVNQNGKVEGYAYELLLELMQNSFKDLDSGSQPISANQVQVMPLIRALQGLQKSSQLGVFPVPYFNEDSVGRSEYSTFAMKAVGPLAKVNMNLYMRADDAGAFNHLDDLRQISSIGVLKGGAAHRLLLDHGFQNVVTIPENGTTDDIDLMLYMLQNQRINAVAMNQAHFKDAIRTSSLEAKQFSEVYKFGQVFLYLVLSPDIDDSVVRLLNEGLKNMVANNQLADIYRKYISSDFLLPLQHELQEMNYLKENPSLFNEN